MLKLQHKVEIKLHKEDEPEKLYQISKDEIVELIYFTFIICVYLFLILLLVRRIFVLRPLVTKALETRDEHSESEGE